MKKLLAPLTLLFLVACQPSELERCVEANTEPTPINNWIIKDDKHYQIMKEMNTKLNDETFDYADNVDDEVKRYHNSLNALEKIVDKCFSDKFDFDNFQGLIISEQQEYRKEIIQFCLSSTENEVKELQLKIETENREKAKSICHSQGIY